MSASVYENIKRTAQATIDGYNKWDLDAIFAPRADDCIYQLRPLSLKQPSYTNEEHREFYASQIFPLFQNFKVEVESTIIDPAERKSIIHGFSSAQTPLGPYGPTEMMLIMKFNETASIQKGEKVTRMDEFFDSAMFVEFMGRIQAHAQAQSEQK